jgi:PPOX class probable F420-dependent enzyme
MIEAMGVQLTDLARRLVDEHAFAVLSTINPDGAPQSSVIWVKRDGGDVVFSTIRGRRKTRNMERDPRVSLCMYDPADPYLYTEIRGRIEMVEEGGRELINELSLTYDDRPFRIEELDVVRVVCRIDATKIIDHQ